MIVQIKTPPPKEAFYRTQGSQTIWEVPGAGGEIARHCPVKASTEWVMREPVPACMPRPMYIRNAFGSSRFNVQISAQKGATTQSESQRYGIYMYIPRSRYGST